MADEEQPFLRSHGRADSRSPKGSRGIKALSFRSSSPNSRSLRIVVMTLAVFVVIAIFAIFIRNSIEEELHLPGSCDTVHDGYQCRTQISRSWGQYAPYFKVPSEISPAVPAGCDVKFVQVLSRHGGRDPTLGKSILYAETIDKIQKHVKQFSGSYAFLANYSYSLGADQLTTFGEQQMVSSGIDFFTRYTELASSSLPFIRASGQQRVINSAERFSQGYYEARTAAGKSEVRWSPKDFVIVSEASGANTTLDHGICAVFEESNNGQTAQSTFTSTFIPAITARLNHGLPAANLSDQETIFLMDICPFETIAASSGQPSKMCDLFSGAEWDQYDYYQTLGKYYGFGPGNPLGPTQGVGYVNELIARMTGKAVVDHTSSNTTLDKDPATFPLGRTIYADFGHDNTMTSVFAALGLYNSTPLLSTSKAMTVDEMKGYSAARTVPFAARAFFEKMSCDGTEEELVRVLINGRVLPLEICGGDALGRCTLSDFIKSLSFARSGGRWDQCLAEVKENGTNNVQLSSTNGDVQIS